VPSMDPTRDRSAPAIPSFASLRGPTRRSPVDVLVAGEQPAVQPATPPPTGRTPQPPRPPEWADLLHLAVHLAGVAVTLPTRLVRRVLGA
jgi:hypothetical protein